MSRDLMAKPNQIVIDRPLWYLAPGGIPVCSADTKKLPRDARWQAREGDAAWAPVEGMKAQGAKEDVLR